MKVTRLPGIHHDGNIVLVSGTLGHVLIDAGTSWYQSLQVERIQGLLHDAVPDRLLLTSRRFPVSGGASHLSITSHNMPVHIHQEGQAALETGDFFTTWANRYDSDMPRTNTHNLLLTRTCFRSARVKFKPWPSPVMRPKAWDTILPTSQRWLLERFCLVRTDPRGGTCQEGHSWTSLQVSRR